MYLRYHGVVHCGRRRGPFGHIGNRLLVPVSCKGSFICTIPQGIENTTAFDVSCPMTDGTASVLNWMENDDGKKKKKKKIKITRKKEEEKNYYLIRQDKYNIEIFNIVFPGA